MKFADLPEVSHSMTGYERVWVLPKHWPAWREPSGKCFALTFDNRFGGLWSPDVVVAKEEIPPGVFASHGGEEISR